MPGPYSAIKVLTQVMRITSNGDDSHNKNERSCSEEAYTITSIHTTLQCLIEMGTHTHTRLALPEIQNRSHFFSIISKSSLNFASVWTLRLVSSSALQLATATVAKASRDDDHPRQRWRQHTLLVHRWLLHIGSISPDNSEPTVLCFSVMHPSLSMSLFLKMNSSIM